MIDKDTFLTLKSASQETLYKDRNSKFFGYAYPIQNENDVKTHLSALKSQHPNAGHFCYAYQLGVDRIQYRANDDGEPNNSAGMPIYGQIQSFDLTNVLVVSVRYFGGTKLGVGGLISAYKTSAKLSLEAAEIIKKTVTVNIQLNFEYDLMNKIMRIIKEKNLEIIRQKMEMSCEIVVSSPKSEVSELTATFNAFYPLEFRFLKS